MSNTSVQWLRSLAKQGDKGVVNNVDARALGRIADEIERLQAEVERLSVIRPEIIKQEAEHLGLVPLKTAP